MIKTASRQLFFYQGDKLITVKQGDQHRAIFRHEALPLAEQQMGGDHSTALLATDDKGSVLVAADEGDLEDHRYSAYGHDPTQPSARTVTGFNGEVFHSASTSYLLGQGYRAYSPRLARFLGADSWSPFGQGGLNAYAYCGGDPLNSIDPSGHYRFYLPNGQIMIKRKNITLAAGSWLPPPGLNKTAHRQALINTTLQKPRTATTETLDKVFEVFKNPRSSTELAHVQETDMPTFKRNRAEIATLTRLHDERDRAPALNYLDKAARLMNENESIIRIGEQRWRQSTVTAEPHTTVTANATSDIRRT